MSEPAVHIARRYLTQRFPDWSESLVREVSDGVVGALGVVLREGHDWREEAWQCYVHSGADPDGADARHLNPDEAVEAVKELMRDYDAALAELAGEKGTDG